MRTIKQAQEKGLQTQEIWLKSYGRCPKPESIGVSIKGKVFFSRDETEPIFSKTEGKEKGLKLNSGAEPVHQRYLRKAKGYYDLYRASDFSPAKERRTHSPVMVDFLCAIFTVNRAAKRFRDAATKLYESSFHSLSQANSKRKKRLYALKDAAIREAYRRGLLQPMAIHGGLVLYQGSGFCFHSSQVPVEFQDKLPNEADGEVFFRESVPKSSAEVKLKDAEFTLSACVSSNDGFATLEVPRIAAPQLQISPLIGEAVHDFSDDDSDDIEWEYSYQPEGH